MKEYNSLNNNKKYNILFVCLGNICRSAAAEEVFRTMAAREGRSREFEADSAGMIDYHEGELPDARMRSHAARRGYRLTHRSRPVRPDDFARFDLVVAMDGQNERGLLRLAPDDGARCKVVRMASYLTRHGDPEIPDPYYGGDEKAGSAGRRNPLGERYVRRDGLLQELVRTAAVAALDNDDVGAVGLSVHGQAHARGVGRSGGSGHLDAAGVVDGERRARADGSAANHSVATCVVADDKGVGAAGLHVGDARCHGLGGREAQRVAVCAGHGALILVDGARVLAAAAVAYAALHVVEVGVDVGRGREVPRMELARVKRLVVEVEQGEVDLSLGRDDQAAALVVGHRELAQAAAVAHGLRVRVVFEEVGHGRRIAAQERACGAVHVVFPRTAGVVGHVFHRAVEGHAETYAAQIGGGRHVGCLQVHRE